MKAWIGALGAATYRNNVEKKAFNTLNQLIKFIYFACFCIVHKFRYVTHTAKVPINSRCLARFNRFHVIMYCSKRGNPFRPSKIMIGVDLRRFIRLLKSTKRQDKGQDLNPKATKQNSLNTCGQCRARSDCTEQEQAQAAQNLQSDL